MANFNIKGVRFDGAFCTVDTFRHLLTEEQARQHLISLANALKKNGIYILGLHFLTNKKINNKVIRWTNKRGRLTVKTSMTNMALDRKKRQEKLRVVLKPETTVKKQAHTSIYPLRTYTLKQLKHLLKKTDVFEIVEVYDEYYDLNRTISLSDKTEYAVLVLKKK